MGGVVVGAGLAPDPPAGDFKRWLVREAVLMVTSMGWVNRVAARNGVFVRCPYSYGPVVGGKSCHIEENSFGAGLTAGGVGPTIRCARSPGGCLSTRL